MRKPLTHSTGFTIIELMVTIAVLGILVGIGVPALTDLIRNNRIATQTNAVVGALNFARAETAVRGLPVAICAANVPRTACDDGANWANGWIIFTDRTGDLGEFDADDELLQTGEPPVTGFALAVTDGNAASGFVRFGVGAAPATARTLTITPTNSGACASTGRRVIAVGLTGRVNTSKVNC